ncbi:MAG TPA: hypothetical protein VNA32_08990 [Actinomycetota bacterium]|nr:hypothetical protein [Actinomycetota bacterium]
MFKKLKADLALAVEILKILPEFWADYKASKIIAIEDIGDVKRAIAKIEGILTPGPTTLAVAGTVVVAAPPAGHVLVAVPAEHVDKLPEALASIVGNVGAGIQNVIPK